MLFPRLRSADDLLDGNLLFTESYYRIQDIPSVIRRAYAGASCRAVGENRGSSRAGWLRGMHSFEDSWVFRSGGFLLKL